MGYKTKINTNVNKAFNLVKDLAEDITFNKKSLNFDFNTATAKTQDSESVITKAIITDINKTSKEHNAMYKMIMLKTQDIGDIKAYDTIIINSESWKIGPIIKSDGYITIVEIYKEV